MRIDKDLTPTQNLFVALFGRPENGEPVPDLHSSNLPRLLDIIHTLPEREEHYVLSYFGIGRPRKTYRAIADKSGISPEPVRRVTNRGLRQLAYHPRVNQIRSLYLSYEELFEKVSRLEQELRDSESAVVDLEAQRVDLLEAIYALGRAEGTQRPIRASDPILLSEAIEVLDLSPRAFSCLNKAGITTIDRLLRNTPEDILKIRNIGQKSFDEIVKKLADLGLYLLDMEP